MKKIFTTVFAFLFSLSYLMACQVEVILGADGTYYTAVVVADGDWSLTWPDGSGGETYPVSPDEPTVCVTLNSDAGGCFITDCFTSVDPEECSASLSINDANMICVEAVGEAPFSYFWDCGAIEECIEYMGPMDYCISVVDAQGCVVELCEFFDLEEPCSVSIVPQINGQVLLAQPTGQAPFTYLWSDGHACPSVIVEPGVTYCVTIVDAAGCEVSACYDLPEDCAVDIVWDPAGFNLLLADANGVAPFEYLWSTGEIGQNVFYVEGVQYCVTIIDATGCVAEDCFFNEACAVDIVVEELPDGVYLLQALAIGEGEIEFMWNTGEAGPVIEVQQPGEYSVVIIDETGCVSDASVTIGGEQCYVSIEAAYLDFTNLVELYAFGIGEPPFEFFWSTGETGSSIVVSASGEYCVEMVDVTGCLATSCFTLINDNCFVEVVEVIDANGDLALFADAPGGDALIYTWNDGTSGAYLYNPVPGENYCVTIEDDLGCTASACWTNTDCAAEILIEFSTIGEYVLHAFGLGVAPFTFVWDNGEVGEILMVQEPGIYCVWMTDAVGCETEACIIVDEFACSVAIHASGDNNVTELTAAAFGVAPFTYLWTTGEATQSIAIDEPGTYCVEVIDAEGCLATDCFEVVGPPSNCIVFIWEENTNDINYLHALGLSEEPIGYTWSTGAVSETIEVTEPGEYCVTVFTSSGANCNACYFFDFPVSTNEITGLIHLPDPVATSLVQVELFELINGAAADLIAVDSVEVNPGFDSQYYFGEQANGDYIIRASEIEGIVPPTYVPTYHFMSLTSNEAAIITTPHNVSTWYSILMIPVEGNSEGPGLIGGQVIDGTGRSVDEAGINVILTTLDGDPVDFNPTVLDGTFQMEDIAYGEYYLLVDVPGLPLAKDRISITPEEPIHNEIQIVIEEGGIVLGATVINEIALLAYPNPAQDFIRIQGMDKELQSVSYKLYGTDGKLYKYEADYTIKDDIAIGDLTAGLYILQLQIDDKLQTIKIVKEN